MNVNICIDIAVEILNVVDILQSVNYLSIFCIPECPWVDVG